MGIFYFFWNSHEFFLARFMKKKIMAFKSVRTIKSYSMKRHFVSYHDLTFTLVSHLKFLHVRFQKYIYYHFGNILLNIYLWMNFFFLLLMVFWWKLPTFFAIILLLDWQVQKIWRVYVKYANCLSKGNFLILLNLTMKFEYNTQKKRTQHT